MDDRKEPRRLLIAVAASLLLHTIAACAMYALGGFHPGATALATLPDDLFPPDPIPPDPEKNLLGISDSDAVTLTWLGFDEYKEHLAPESDVEQAGLAINPSPASPVPLPDFSADEAQAPTPSEPTLPDIPAPAPVAQAAQPAPSQPLPGPEVTLAPPAPEALVSPPIPLPTEALAVLEPADAPTPTEVSEPPRPDATPAPDPAPTQSAVATPPTPTADAPQPSPSASADSTRSEIGLPSDRESDALSTVRAPFSKLGQPLASQGLEIKTVRPRWPTYTLLTASPRDPLIEVLFRKDGRVHSARFLQSTGRDDVDAPLLSAVYNWTAQGEALSKLPDFTLSSDPSPQDPPTVRLVFRIGLRR